MASIRRAPRTGRWEVRYRDPAGKQRTKTLATKADARAFVAALDHDLRSGHWVDPTGGRTTLADWTERWWATTTNLRASTLARDESYIANHVLPPFGDRQLATITQLDVRGWVADLDAAGLAPATVTKAYQILGKIMAAAVDGGLIPASPCRRVPLPRVERQEMRYLTPAEVARLAEVMPERWRQLVYVGAYGGLRVGEIAGLRRGRVDLLRGTLDVAEIAVEVRGRLTFGPPKTRAGRRSVSLPRTVVDGLAGHLARFSGDGPDGFVFTGRTGGTLRAGSFRQRTWAAATAAAGLDGLRIHDLRHTAVALWIAAGASPKEIAQRAGHTSVAVVLDRYGHLLPGADEALRGRLDAMLADAQTLPAAAAGQVVALRPGA